MGVIIVFLGCFWFKNSIIRLEMTSACLSNFLFFVFCVFVFCFVLVGKGTMGSVDGGKERTSYLRIMFAFVFGCLLTFAGMYFWSKSKSNETTDDYSNFDMMDDFEFNVYQLPSVSQEELKAIQEKYAKRASCSPSQEHPKGCAYTTLVTKDEYIEYALVLAESVKASGTQYPFVCFVTPKLSARGIEILKNSGMIVQYIEELKIPPSATPRREAWLDSFHKLRLFGMVEYERLVFLDADSIVLSSLDGLFDKHGEFLSATDRHLCKHETVPGPSGMVNVIWPNSDTEKAILDFFQESKHMFPRGDQSVTEDYFQHRQSSRLIDSEDSSFVFSCQCQEDPITPKSIHFTSWFRPHVNSANGEVSVPLGLSIKAKECAGYIYKRWEELWERAIEKQKMTKEEILQESIRPYHPPPAEKEAKKDE